MVQAPIHNRIHWGATSLAVMSLLIAPAASNPSASIAAREPLSPEFPIQAALSSPITYEVDFSVAITAPYRTKKLQVWLPLPQSDATQQITRRDLLATPIGVSPQISKESSYGNEFAYFEFDHPEGGQIIRHRFEAKVHELRWHVQSDQVAMPKTWPTTFDPYFRRPALLANNETFATVIQQIGGSSNNPSNVFDVMQWVDRHLTYDHARASLRADAAIALHERRGHCSDYHGLCATMGQALGCPTRVTYGLNLFPKNSPSHCKLEAFLPPYGWVSFDVSETQRFIAAIGKDATLSPDRKQQLIAAARERFQRGFRDNTWLCVTRGTDFELAPPASTRVPVVRTIYAEADGVALPDPDPANPKQREFAWMTVLDCRTDQKVVYPFNDSSTLQPLK